MNSTTIEDFFKPYIPILLADKETRIALMNTNVHAHKHATPEEKLALFIEEAQLTYDLIDCTYLNSNNDLLEVGAGIGLCYAYLQKQGYNIWAIEPAGQSIYSEYSIISEKLFQILKINKSNWFHYRIEDLSKLPQKFDFIFSNFVLEHVNDSESAIVSIMDKLKPNGKTKHNTVNYNVPYEPHLNIILLPIRPDLTHKIRKSLQSDDLWSTLNFISLTQVKHICNKYKYGCSFVSNTTFRFLERLAVNEEFRKRKRALYWIYKTCSFLKLQHLAKLLPTKYNTPLTFIISK